MVDRPAANVVTSLNRLGWLKDERERYESTTRLIQARDRALDGAATVRVDFEALRATPAVVIRRLAEDLRLEVTEAQVQAAADSIVRPREQRREAHNADPAKHLRDLLLAKLRDDPEDARSVFSLAQTYFALGDFVNARQWYARRVEMGGWEEEVYFAMWQIAQSMAQLGAPWPEVQNAYLRAWKFRPTRAEPLYAIAYRYCLDRRYRLGYRFARLAADIPFPDDLLVLDPEIYAWRATDAQAVCAAGSGRQAEAFTLWRRLLARPDISDADRRRMTGNRDVCASAMITAAAAYPEALVPRLVAASGEADVVVSLLAGPDRGAIEQTLNSFLNCCLDVARVGRFLAVVAGLCAQDRAILLQRYGFLQFVDPGPGDWPGARLAQLRASIRERFWLHLSDGWRFFAPENFITRLTAVLKAEAQVFQVGINFADAVTLTGTCAAEQEVRRAPAAGRYVLTDAVASGPAMFDTARLDRAGGLQATDTDPSTAVGRRAAAAGLRTASLDEVLCINVA
ncbi:glycosyl transferase [Mycobacterium sp.]|uniref:glycosyl transferase n=1 Tax=Mycobacterium sp. TaxID=1785 RepID=UPI0012790DC4|nr:glycosyl transferase [Mycobacterium sp.]KAA8957416.1 MAG: glycosyl transferase [Mycobacterium sp.]